MVTCRIEAYDLNGKTVGRIINNKTLSNDATIREAIDSGYVVGKADIIKQNVAGVLRSMVRGIERDGNGRKIDGYLTLNAFPKGSLPDVTDNLDSKNAKVVLRARMLKEFNNRIRTAGWSFIIEGSTGTFTLDLITTGEKSGEIVLGEDILLNGKDLTMGEGDTISWLVPETGATGTVASAFITCDLGRIKIARDGVQELFVAENNGKAVVFTVKINNKHAAKSAVMKYVD